MGTQRGGGAHSVMGVLGGEEEISVVDQDSFFQSLHSFLFRGAVLVPRVLRLISLPLPSPATPPPLPPPPPRPGVHRPRLLGQRAHRRHAVPAHARGRQGRTDEGHEGTCAVIVVSCRMCRGEGDSS
jgi:hypothetical protein